MNQIKHTIIEEYWINKLAVETTPLSFAPSQPYDKEDGTPREGLLEIPVALSLKLKKVAKDSEIGQFILLSAAFNILLKKYTGAKSLIVGTLPPTSQIVSTPGPPLFTKHELLDNVTVREHLHQTRKEIQETFNYSDYSLDDVLKRVRDRNKNAAANIHSIAFLYEPFQERDPLLEAFDSVMVISEKKPGQQQLMFQYFPRVFPEEIAIYFAKNFLNCLEAVLESPEKQIRELEFLGSEERDRALFFFNKTDTGYPRDKTIQSLFIEQAEKNPGKIALFTRKSGVDEDGPSLTYGQLHQKTDQLAYHLQSRGVGTDSIVAVMTHRSVDSVIGLLAVLKAGGAFLPIDPGDPESRKRLVIGNSGVKVLLTQKHLPDKAPALSRILPARNMLCIDDENLYGSSDIRPRCSDIPDSTAYIIYTSGSTGIPKGVIITHRNAVNYLSWGIKQYMNVPNLTVPLFTSLSFDLTVTSVFTPLLSGNTVAVYEGLGSEPLIESVIRENRVDVVKLTPAHLKLILAQMESRLSAGETFPSRIKRFIVGGEALETPLAGKVTALFREAPEIFNEYGPTEATVGCMIYRFSPGTDFRPTVPIGNAIDNARIYLLDNRQRTVPYGVVGEIYISGEGVARGYLNRPDLTREKFSANPFLPGERMYRTGDIARYLPDGNIEFLGRIDHQVKIRGFRIELGEIESKLIEYNKHPSIMDRDSQAILAGLNRVRRCTRCLLPENYPGIHFDADGVCSECREYDTYKYQVDKYFKSEEDFFHLLRESKESMKNKYDCLLLFSGGKDSTYVLYQLIDMGLKVLTFTFDNGYISDAAFANIKHTTSNLGVDHITETAKNMNKIFVHSLNENHNVCHGCWNVLNTIGMKVAHEHGINLVISGLSRGQIFEMRLEGLFKRGIFDEREVEDNLLMFRKSFHSKDNKFSRILNPHQDESLVEQIQFVDFFRYYDTPVKEIRAHLKEKGWIQPVDTGFCSSNCIINDVGIYVHLHDTGYHFYAAQSSWDCRLGGITREKGLQEVSFEGDVQQVHAILEEIGYYRSPVKSAVVIDREGADGDKYLCAYIVTDDELTAADLRKHLAAEIPEYMIPSFFVTIDEIPLTPGGKLDRNALPAPDLTVAPHHITPKNPREEKMAEIWSDVLGVEKDIVGSNSNFFELGGNSLKATFLSAKIQKILKVDLPLEQVFKAPILSILSEKIKKFAYSEFHTIPPAEEKAYYSLSPTQVRLYILQQMEPESTGYNIPLILNLEGKLEKERFENAFRMLIARHESLRTSFHIVEEIPMQKIRETAVLAVEYFESGNSGETDSSAVSSIISGFIRSFDLTHAPLMRVGLIACPDNRHILLVDMHHIITDGISQNILIEEFVKLYTETKLSSPTLRYRDYSEWQHSEGQKEILKTQETYWLELLKGEIPILDLPTDYPRPRIQSFEGKIAGFTLPREDLEALKNLARKEKTTLYIMLLTLFFTFLHKLSGQEDIIVGTDVSGRTHGDLEGIIGMLVNTLALRRFPQGRLNFDEFLHETSQRTLEALENQEFPFEDLVNRVAVERNAARNPLFDIMFSFLEAASENESASASQKMELEVSPYPFENKTSKFDLTLNVLETQEQVLFNFEYCTKLFSTETIQRFIVYFKKTVASVAAAPTRIISSINLLPQEEKKRLLTDFNDTQSPFPADKSYSLLFEEQVERNPHRTAAVFSNQHLTYRELNNLSDGIAHYLYERNVTENTFVALLMKRNIPMLASIIGTFKAGAAYLPLETDYPESRIEYILRYSDVSAAITEPEFQEQLENLSGNLATLTHILSLPPNRPLDGTLPHSLQAPLRVEHHPGNPAYMLYTSGTTGEPKGVVIHQAGMINHLYAKINDLDIAAADIIAQTASACFDISVWQFLAALLVGGNTVIIDRDTVLEPPNFLRQLQRKTVTILESVPSLMTAFLESASQELDKKLFLRWMIPTGEALGVPLVRLWFRHYPGIPLVNAYGPTEASDDVTHYTISRPPLEEQRSIPVGKPVQNIHIYILDENLSLCPIGVKGEICVAGIGVGHGYWKDKEKTSRAFVPNPYLEEIGDADYKTLYRTGDIGYYRDDGNIECLGRLDFQVKIRGNRIELGEIERRLLSHEDVKEAVTIARENENGGKYLCAYFVADESAPQAPGTSQLRKHLSDSLPEYMIPSYFSRLEQLPLTPNGKVDRKALPEPDVQASAHRAAPPRSKVETAITEVWKDVLGLAELGIEDNFFEMGGDSIMAIQLAARLKKYRLELKINDLFLHPTISELANWVRPMSRIPHQGPVEGEVELTPIQHWFFGQGFSAPHHYNLSIMLHYERGFREDYVKELFEHIVRHHDALRMVFIRKEGKIMQRNRKIDGKLFDWESFTLDSTCMETVKAEIKKEAGRIQGSIDLSTGPLVKLGLFKTTFGDHLLIAVHHLVMDGVSWRIVLEDFHTGYRQLMNNREINFPEKTDSFQYWSQALKEYIAFAGKNEDEDWREELEHWKAIEDTGIHPLPRDHQVPPAKRIRKYIKSVSIRLDESDTEKLTTEANWAYSTEINDILLAALSLAFREWSGNSRVLINLEGHGREFIGENVDISRTAGWFTVEYPVILETEDPEELPGTIKGIKESLRNISNNGIGYGLLRYLATPEKTKGLTFSKEPEISFNYLGRFGRRNTDSQQAENDTGDIVFNLSEMDPGDGISPEMEEPYVITINGMLVDGYLSISFLYNRYEYEDATVEALADIYKSNLRKLISHCIQRESKESTPSDFDYSDMNMEDLDSLKDDLSDIL